jgi:hypothetical protein
MRGFHTKTLYKGEYTLVDLVDETIEVTVQNNVYSLSETLDLKQELTEIADILEKRIEKSKVTS